MSSLPPQSIFLGDSLAAEFAPLAYLVVGDFSADAQDANFVASEAPVPAEVRAAVRGLLRFGGFKPSGRGRPASEALAKAVEDARWPNIHPLVDCCNLLSLRSGLPISVLDASLLKPPLTIRVGLPEEEYVFNPSGQSMGLKGLLVLADADGPTGSPVKDAQRSKVSALSREFLILVWGTSVAEQASQQVSAGLLEWCQEHRADCTPLRTAPAPA